LIRPVLLYGSETWGLTKRKENRLLVFGRKVLRTIVVDGVSRTDRLCRYNFELDKEFNSPNAIGVVKSNRLRYARRMIRGAKDLPQRSLYWTVPEGRRNQKNTEIQMGRWREQR
jgi:hypothetical protein